MSTRSRSLRILQDFNCFADLFKVGGYVSFAMLWMTYFFTIYLFIVFCLSSESVLRRYIKPNTIKKIKQKIVKFALVSMLTGLKSFKEFFDISNLVSCSTMYILLKYKKNQTKPKPKQKQPPTFCKAYL